MHCPYRQKRHWVLAFGLFVGAGAAVCGCTGDDNSNNNSQDGGLDSSTVKGDGSASNDAGSDGSASNDAGSDASFIDSGIGTDSEAGAANEGGSETDAAGGLPGSPGPDAAGTLTQTAGSSPNLTDGQQVFRFETFGNEGYWTRVLKLPQGVVTAGVTPAQALAAGLSIDIDAVPAAMAQTIASQLADAGAGGDPTLIPAFQDPAVTEALIEANAVVGVVARNVTTLNGTLDINTSDVYAGESVGVSCAFCHSITDGSTLNLPKGGSIGHRIDGPSNHNLQVGKLVALASNSIAFYPTLALDLVSNNHMSVSRKGVGVGLLALPATLTEADVDAYLNDPTLYPVGMFDDQPDGNGAPMHIQALFRQDLAAPYGSDGSIHQLQNFSNLVYTALLDPTDLLSSAPAPNAPTDAGADAAAFSGPQYLEYEKGGAAGLELISNYKIIIESTLGIPPYVLVADGGADGGPAGNNGYPFVGRYQNECVAAPAGVENEPSIGGLKCDQTKLLDMNAYLFSLHAPPGVKIAPTAIAAGRAVFRQQCTSCHNDDQSLPVPQDIVAFNATVDLYTNAPTRPALFPAWTATTSIPRPGPPFGPGLVPAKDYAASIFDDKMILTEASNYKQPRGDALPLLMDLARKPSFLHDDEVASAGGPTDSLSLLLDPSRGTTAPHPFSVTDATQRASVVTFLQSLDDSPLSP
jgi:cytochrome c2